MTLHSIPNQVQTAKWRGRLEYKSTAAGGQPDFTHHPHSPNRYGLQSRGIDQNTSLQQLEVNMTLHSNPNQVQARKWRSRLEYNSTAAEGQPDSKQHPQPGTIYKIEDQIRILALQQLEVNMTLHNIPNQVQTTKQRSRLEYKSKAAIAGCVHDFTQHPQPGTDFKVGDWTRILVYSSWTFNLTLHSIPTRYRL